MSQPNPQDPERSALLDGAPPIFLDAPMLLELSQPRPRVNLIGPGLIALVVLIFGSAYLSSRSDEMKGAVDAASSVLMVLLVTSMGATMWWTVRRQRFERAGVDAIEELVQLRRWDQAALMLELSLSRPALTQQSRVQMLYFLAMTLARYNRFDDAVVVHNHLLDTIPLDGPTAHAVRLARAMAMLREDHLFDADGAISELRRGVKSSETDADAPPPVSAGLSLVEIYRDVKTGHAREAIELFDKTLPVLRAELGHRVADAYALAARAHDFVDERDAARRLWENATLLAPARELMRRYPELSSVAQKYPAAAAPAEAA